MKGPTRRNLLLAGAWGSLAGGLVITGNLVSGVIGRRPASSRRLVSVGPLTELRIGAVTTAPDLIVIHDERGIAAVSSRCTHLGCTVTTNARGFECACHGSRFSRDGQVLTGPATDALPWYRVILGNDGELRIDLDEVVGPETRLVPETEG